MKFILRILSGALYPKQETRQPKAVDVNQFYYLHAKIMRLLLHKALTPVNKGNLTSSLSPVSLSSRTLGAAREPVEIAEDSRMSDDWGSVQ